MKTSHVTIALCLCMTALASEGSAQLPPAKADAAEMEALTDKARQLYVEGLDALKKSRWAEAHASLLAAWRIKPHYQVASNLGASEIKLGKYRDAAEHISYYLREAPKTKEKERQRAQAFLDEALAKVGSVTPRGLPDGAEVKVDGAVVGVVPLAGPLFMEPGAHVIEARLDGYAPATHPIQASEGAVQEVQLRLEKIAPPPLASVTAPLPSASSAPPPPRPLPMVERRPLWPAIATGGVAVVAFAVGAGLTGAAGAKRADAVTLRAKLGTASGACANPPLPGAAASCSALQNDIADHDALNKAALGTFIAGGALVVVGAGLVGWMASGPTVDKSSKPTTRIAPLVGRGEAGAVLVGTW